ncbi:MAG: hypothetical protein JWO09_1331 [Bacteroidetes bacterium]|nr:hypothetical protein [Bacteroidota bacterium]
MLKKIIFGVFIALCLAGGVYWFVYTKELRTPVTEGINAIPASAALIFESRQAKNTWKKLSQTNIMWEELLGTEMFRKLNLQARCIDSILQLNPNVSALLDEHSVFISAHPAGKESFHFLFVYSLPNRTYQPDLEEFLEKQNKGKEIVYADYENRRMGKLEVPGKGTWHFSFVEGTLIMSTDELLLQESIRQLNSGISLARDKDFSKVLTTAGKKVDANVYINYKTFPGMLTQLIRTECRDDLAGLADFAGCSGWDVTVKPNALMLSGFTATDDSSHKSYLDIFSNQKPQSIGLTSIIPSKTALMIFYGISNTTAFRNDYKRYLEASATLPAYEEFIRSAGTAWHLDIEHSMAGWIDNEIALVVTEPAGPDFSDNTFAVMHSNTIAEALASLNAAADSVAAASGERYDTASFRGHVINRLNIPRLLPQLFGPQFNRISNCYFTPVGDYIVFGNSEDALRNFIGSFENNKTLAADKNYISFAENISSEANIYVYSAIARSANIYKNFSSPALSTDIDKRLELFHKFEAAGIQFSSNNNLFYSNVYLKYNPAYKQETGTLWESKLDTTLSARPYLVTNHNTKAREVLVQDDANKIYLISNTGKVIWTKQLHEKIMSEVIQVDVLKNNKLQMVFNTRSFIYMFDRNGNDMKGFPVQLRSPATNAISVTDYENNRDYRIFIACENQRILGYKATGEPVAGFEAERTANPVYLPLQYFNAGNKDHLCAVDVKGKVYIFDRHGAIRVKMKEQLPQGARNFYVEAGKDYKRSYIVAADTLGNITRLSLSGDKEKMKFQDFETSPYFEYRDINNDKTKEYIFLGRKELKVFDAGKSLLFNYEFGDEITQAPQFFLFPDGSGKIGVTSEASGELYLFNDNGSLFNSFPLKGKTAFSIGDLNNEGSFNLITGSADNSIYVYQLQ